MFIHSVFVHSLFGTLSEKIVFLYKISNMNKFDNDTNINVLSVYVTDGQDKLDGLAVSQA